MGTGVVGLLLVTAFLVALPGAAAHHAGPGECQEYEGERTTERHCGALAPEEVEDGNVCAWSEEWDYDDDEYRQHYENSFCILSGADSESSSSASDDEGTGPTDVGILCTTQGSGAGGGGSGGGSYEESCVYKDGCLLYHFQGEYQTGEPSKETQSGICVL